jgi:hypothetical protein
MTLGDAHDLLPQEIAKDIPPLHATEERDDPLVHVKWFTPDASWTWYVIEYGPVDRICYGFVVGLVSEFGYFSLDEIRESRGPWGLHIERDLSFQKKPISACWKE